MIEEPRKGVKKAQSGSSSNFFGLTGGQGEIIFMTNFVIDGSSLIIAVP
jgi:hypothetical protein